MLRIAGLPEPSIPRAERHHAFLLLKIVQTVQSVKQDIARKLPPGRKVREMKKNHEIAFVAIATAVIMSGCGETATSSNSNSIIVNTFAELETCSGKNENQLAYVISENSGYVCMNQQWASSSKISTSTPSCATCEYGTLYDNRDGQTYRTVKIGEQWWMAENLNYAYTQPTETMDSSSFCINNDPAFCQKYGRFYLVSAIMDSVGLFSKNGLGCGNDDCNPIGNVRGACPLGWHIPSVSEGEILFASVGGETFIDEDGDLIWKGVAPKLISPNITHSTDFYGFNAIPINYYVDYDDPIGSLLKVSQPFYIERFDIPTSTINRSGELRTIRLYYRIISLFDDDFIWESANPDDDTPIIPMNVRCIKD